MKFYQLTYILILFLMIDLSHPKFLGEKSDKKNEYLRYSKMSGKELKKYLLNKNVYIIDTRDISISAVGYIPQSILCPTSMYSWLTSIVPSGADVIIINDESNYQQSINSLIEINLFNLLGYAIYDELNENTSFNIQQVEYNPNTKESIQEIVDNGENIIDIREISEFRETGVIKEAILIPLTSFLKDYTKIPNVGNVYVFCKSGMRAVVGMSYAKRAGYTYRLVIMSGGMNKAIEEGYASVPYQ